MCLYGLNRSLRHTLESLRRRLYGPLLADCYSVDTFFHTWAGGGAPEELRLLPRVRDARVDDQDAFDATEANFSAFEPLDHRFRGANFRNLLRQLASLQRVARLWRRHAADYDVVVYVRPDLLLLDDLNTSQLAALGPHDLLTPYWHRYTGLNDRLAAARPRAADVFGQRRDDLWDYATHRGYVLFVGDCLMSVFRSSFLVFIVFDASLH